LHGAGLSVNYKLASKLIAAFLQLSLYAI